MREHGRPAAARARMGVEVSSSESPEFEARTTRVEVDRTRRGEATSFAFAARRGEAANALPALAAGRDARAGIDERAIVRAADMIPVECGKEIEEERRRERGKSRDRIVVP